MSTLPEFKTSEEWAEFWETHSTADYPEEFETVTDTQINRKAIRRNRMARELLDEALYQRLVKIAEKRRESPVVVARRWLEERVTTEEGWIAAREKQEPYADQS